jgi:hypothetical protein
VRASVGAQDLSYVRFTQKERSEKPIQNDQPLTVKTSSQTLSISGNSESEIMLDYTDALGKTYPLAFGLQYYNPSNGTYEGEPTLPSGAYIFKPKMDD